MNGMTVENIRNNYIHRECQGMSKGKVGMPWCTGRI